MRRWFEIATQDWVQKVLNGEDLEIGAAAHYMIGGIRVNGKIETNISGLYAAGECNGNLWGATRVASAISEVILEGRCAALSALDYIGGSADVRIDWEQVESVKQKTLRPLEKRQGRSPIEMRKRIQRIADERVNMLREGGRLESAIGELEGMRGEIAGDVAVQGSRTRRYNLEWIEALQLENLRQCLELTAASALHRKESRGAHFRDDYQQCDNDNWLNNTMIRQEGGKRKVTSEPLVITRLRPPSGVMTYREALGMELASIKGKKEEG
jgi:succinate dehydrogenase/fumarate reductase flavoprotein subunit